MLFVLVLSRVSGLVMAAPIYGSANVPIRLRVFFALALTMMITPVQFDVAPSDPGTLLNLLVFVAVEMVIGLVLGLGIWIFLQMFQIAGQIISQSSGMSLSDVFIPGLNSSIPIFSQLLYMFSLAVFVTIGGHRMAMEGFLQTFAMLPPGQSALSPEIAKTLTTMLSQSFQLGLRVAAPAITALLLATLVMGLISRSLPQMNIMVFGFGVNALLALAVVALSLGGGAWLLEDHIESTIEQLLNGLDGARYAVTGAGP